MARVKQWIEGELSSYAYMNAENETMFAFAATFAEMLLGSASINSIVDGLAAHLTGDFDVTLGGANRTMVLAGRIINEIPQTTLTFTPNTTATVRSDLIVAQLVENAVEGTSGKVMQPDTSVQDMTVYDLAQSCTFAIVAGTGGEGNFGAIPAGFVAVGQIDVPPGSAPLTAVTITLPTLASYLLGACVTALNNQQGPILLRNIDGSISVDSTVPGFITLAAAAAAAAVSSLNLLTGAVVIRTPNGSLTIDASTPPFISMDVNPTGFVSPDGSISIIFNADTKKVEFEAVSVIGSSIVTWGANNNDCFGDITLPGDGHTYVVDVRWTGHGHNFTPNIAQTSGPPLTGFYVVQAEGSGLAQGTLTSFAIGTIVPTVQSVLQFNFTNNFSGGGWTDKGLWKITATRTA